MAPSKEDICLKNINTAEIKIKAYTDEDLTQEAHRIAYQSLLGKFKNLLVGYEDLTVNKINKIVDNDEMNRVAQEYADSSRVLDKELAEWEIKLRNASGVVSAENTQELIINETVDPATVVTGKLAVIDACIFQLKSRLIKEVANVKRRVDDETGNKLTRAKKDCIIISISNIIQQADDKLFGFFREKCELCPDQAETFITA